MATVAAQGARPAGVLPTPKRCVPRIGIDIQIQRARSEFSTGEVRLYPVNLSNVATKRCGASHLTQAVKAVEIFGALQRASAMFGTKIAIVGSVVVIRLRSQLITIGG
jgi:hypothetical protein